MADPEKPNIETQNTPQEPEPALAPEQAPPPPQEPVKEDLAARDAEIKKLREQANEQYARDLSGKMGKADAEREAENNAVNNPENYRGLAEELRSANAMTPEETRNTLREGLERGDAGLDLQQFDRERRAKEANEQYAQNLSRQMDKADAERARQKKEEDEKNNPENYQNIAQIVKESAEQPKKTEQPAKPQPKKTGETPQEESRPAGKTFARKAGEAVGAAARETGRYGKAAVRAGKAMAETYKKSEARRKRENPPEKTFARRAGEVTGAVIRGTKRSVEAIQNYRAERRAEKQAEKQRLESERQSEQARREAERQKVEQELHKKCEDQTVFHQLQKEIQSLRQQIESLKAQNKPEQPVDSFERRLDELLSQREGAMERATGKSIAEMMVDAEKKVAQILGYATREDYIKALSSVQENSIRANGERDFINREFAALPPRQQKKYGNNPELFRKQMEERAKKLGLSQEEIYGLLNAGYKVQDLGKKGFFRIGVPFRSERKIVGPDGKKVWMRTKDFMAMAKMEGENYRAAIADEARRQLGEKWGSEVRKQTEESFEREAGDLNAAIERVRAAYRERRNNIFAELDDSGNGNLTAAQRRAYSARPGKGASTDFFNDFYAGMSGEDGDRVFGSAMKDFGFSARFSKEAASQARKQGRGFLRFFVNFFRGAGVSEMNLKFTKQK